MREIKRALISVFNKEGVVEFAKGLSELGVEIISSGGTFKKLKSEGVPVVEVSEYTGSPEVMEGRVKTLHPRVHGGILFRRNEDADAADLKRLGGKPIDMVVVNLYPFADAIAKPDCTMRVALENIDIGGPSMIRSAAKNWQDVLVVTDVSDYEAVLSSLKKKNVTEGFAKMLAAKAFALTAQYDSMITSYLGGSDAPSIFTSSWKKQNDLRYGENPHQKAALYLPLSKVNGPDLASAQILQGKEISYNNLSDADAAVNLIREFKEPAAAVLKHSNPCGVGLGKDVAEAFVKARDCDPQSAFGGIISVNREVEAALAEIITEAFYEVVVAPSYSGEALEILSRKKNLRLLKVPDLMSEGGKKFQIKQIAGGLLVQDTDDVAEDESKWNVVTKRGPTDDEMKALRFAWKVVKHVKSNAIVFCKANMTVGIGAGQMSRVDSVKIATMKANFPLKGSVLASDAFFPFPDGPAAAHEAGATAIIQPGGSRRDDEVIRTCDERKMAMVFTGRRHFRH